MLERAAHILGGMDEVGAYLGVGPATLSIWLRGMHSLPDHMFLKLVDLISEYGAAPSDSAPAPGRAARRGPRPHR
jgi:hypothetical protein